MLQNVLANLKKITLHFNSDKFSSVVRSQDLYVRQSLEDVLYPEDITTNNEEKLEKLTKLVTGHYNAYKGNYSGNIDFDWHYGSKNSYL